MHFENDLGSASFCFLSGASLTPEGSPPHRCGQLPRRTGNRGQRSPQRNKEVAQSIPSTRTSVYMGTE